MVDEDSGPSADEARFFEADAPFDREAQARAEADPMGISERARVRARGRRARAVVFLSAVLLLGLGLFYWLHEDLFYFLGSTEPTDLGAAEELAPGTLEHDDFVRVRGIARDMCIRADLFAGRVRFLYLLGSEMGKRILIEARAPEGEGCLGAVERVFEGRVTDLSLSRRYVHVVAYYRQHFPFAPQNPPLYLLRDGERPWQDWWYPLIFLAVLALWVINARTLWRLGRARPARGAGGGTG